MKIKISDKGLLYLERAGSMKLQLCPFSPTDGPCGDWCPLFNEESLPGKSPAFELCRAFYSVDLQVVDERKSK